MGWLIKHRFSVNLHFHFNKQRFRSIQNALCIISTRPKLSPFLVLGFVEVMMLFEAQNREYACIRQLTTSCRASTYLEAEYAVTLLLGGCFVLVLGLPSLS